jgi:hypothetical protein
MQITRSSIDTQLGPADWFTGDVLALSGGAACLNGSPLARSHEPLRIRPACPLPPFAGLRR